ncbi:MAG: septum formation initiator family protein [Oscillospiraceae bacterium]
MARKTGITAKLVLLAAMVYGVLSLITLTDDLHTAVAERDRLVAEINETQEKLDLLESALDNQSDPDTTEDFARDELGMVWSGETVFCYKRSAPTG